MTNVAIETRSKADEYLIGLNKLNELERKLYFAELKLESNSISKQKKSSKFAHKQSQKNMVYWKQRISEYKQEIKELKDKIPKNNRRLLDVSWQSETN